MRILFLFLFCIFQNLIFAMQQPFIEISDVNYISNQVCIDFSEKMQKRGLEFAGVGGAEDKGKMRELQICFDFHQVIDLAMARKLIVETVLLFLEEINGNNKIRKYLIYYPFTAKNVIVAISLKCPKRVERNYIASVSSSLGQIYYWKEDNEQMALVDFHEETFEEAQKILKETK